MAWHVFEKLLEGVANYSTFIGKLWITFFFIFRIIIVASIGDTVYSDEQSQFICNTLQPGCSNVCFNRFSPISQIRFWAVQILFAGMPSVIFVVFALHKMSSKSSSIENDEKRPFHDRRSEGYENGRVRRRRPQELDRASNEKNTEAKDSSNHTSLPQYDEISQKRLINGVVKVKDSKKSSSYGDSMSSRLPVQIIEVESEKKKVKVKTVYNKDGKSEVMTTPAISRAYFIQTILTTIIEALFLALQYKMYQFEVHELFVCEGDPCPKKVDCYVSRPQEKTLFLLFMYAVSSLSIFINVIELFHLIRKYFTGGHPMKLNDYLSGYPSRRSDRRYRRRGVRVSAYPTLGPYPRKHGNSLTDSDNGDSIGSDYSFYGR